MARVLLHGLKPANEFLNTALLADRDQLVTLSSQPTQNRERPHDFLLRRAGSNRDMVVYGLSWSGFNSPDNVTLGQYPLTLQPLEDDTRFLERNIHLRLSGIEKIPGLRLPEKGIFTIPLHNYWHYPDSSDCGYFSKDDRVAQEFYRRWKIEAAAELRDKATTRLNKLLRISPFQRD
jgi:hypothetical protein